jgi:hypothetical protein
VCSLAPSLKPFRPQRLSSVVHAYRVLGGYLRADLDFPELAAAPADSPSTWRLVAGAGVPPSPPLELLGADAVRAAGTVRLHRTPDGFRLEYPDTGVYDISRRGSHITWFPPSERPYEAERFVEAVRIDVLGRVLAVAMHAAGTESLHGSAVVLGDGRAVAFVAPKFHGKSTLASALVASGARLITDDTLPVEPGDPPRAVPGVHSVRMWQDSAGLLGETLPGLELGPWGKLQSSGIPKEWLVDEAVSFAAIYVLTPRPPGADGTAVTRQRLVPVEAAVALIAHAKLGPLLGKADAVGLLAWAVHLAEAVPVYRLRFPRDFEQLPQVVTQLRQWHGS